MKINYKEIYEIFVPDLFRYLAHRSFQHKAPHYYHFKTFEEKKNISVYVLLASTSFSTHFKSDGSIYTTFCVGQLHSGGQ